MSVRGRKKGNAGKPYGETGSRLKGKEPRSTKKSLADAARVVANGSFPLDTGAQSPTWKR